jgi:hypothetical protein
MLAGGGLDGVEHEGDPGALQRLLSVLETPCHLRDRHAIVNRHLHWRFIDPRGEARQVRA